LIIATETTYGCVYQQNVFVGETGNIYPLSVQLSVQDATVDGDCDGTAQFFVYGGVTPYTYELTDPNNAVIGTSSSATGLCSGLYTLAVSDNVGNTDTLTFYIADPSNVYVDSVYADTTVIDTLITQVLEDCIIDFATVDTVWIEQLTYVNSDTAVVTWAINDMNGLHYVDQSYVVTNMQGWFAIELSLFCSQKAPGDPYLKILSTIYVNSEQGSAGLSELDDVSNITVYPNPTDGALFIEITGAGYSMIRMYDAKGKQVQMELTDLGHRLEITTPNEVGMYLLELTLPIGYVYRVRFMRVK
jgi:hypothetical protein